jgi:hypothetical protein
VEGGVKGGTKVIDVLASTGEGLVAYEVTLHFENLLSNIQKDLADGVSTVVIVTRNTAWRGPVFLTQDGRGTGLLGLGEARVDSS